MKLSVSEHRIKGKKIANILRALKEKTPCKDCGLKYPYYVMDFDHVNGDKHFSLARARAYDGAKVAAEIRKCEIVCANCHRERTHSRRLMN